jgi:hypothetical protein
MVLLYGKQPTWLNVFYYNEAQRFKAMEARLLKRARRLGGDANYYRNGPGENEYLGSCMENGSIRAYRAAERAYACYRRAMEKAYEGLGP